ncbi:MAG: hypothetical protein C0627_00240 [Sulfurimonas sp.]|nr:MAG: hypothetical protein C0627_00240 [Sulfurimonas sp.]
MKKGYIYILSNNSKTLYVGVTSDLIKRIYEHKNNITKGFTTKYNIKSLVYYEIFDSIEDAITREKQLKAGSRLKKVALIESLNPTWKDIYDELL